MDDDEADSGSRNLGNGHNMESALQLFVNAKKKINDIFRNIGQYVIEADQFVKGRSEQLANNLQSCQRFTKLIVQNWLIFKFTRLSILI